MSPRSTSLSRSGLPYCAKAVAGVDQTGEYQPEIATAAALAALRGTTAAVRPRPLDMRADLLPLMFAEMQLRYHAQSANARRRATVADDVRRRLVAAWRERLVLGRASGCTSAAYGRFDAEREFFGEPGRVFASAKDYEQHLYEMVERDLDESLMPGGSSPVKCAYEVFRIMRDTDAVRDRVRRYLAVVRTSTSRTTSATACTA